MSACSLHLLSTKRGHVRPGSWVLDGSLLQQTSRDATMGVIHRRCDMDGATLADALRISEQLSQADQLRLISLLSERLQREMASDGGPTDMLTMAGVGADLWRDLDVAAYIEQDRSSWDS